MKKILAILGPTSTGKTDLGIKLAKIMGGEIVAADSRQIYKGLDIGTGKLPSKMPNVKFKMSDGFWEINGVKVWMYDLVGLKERYSVFDFAKVGRRVLEDILKKGKIPIIVGGTGLYIKGLLGGLDKLFLPNSKLIDQSNILKIGLTTPREVLYQKINLKVFEWLKEGIVEEVEELIKSGVTKKRFKELGLQYGEIVDYLDGKISKNELIERMQTKTRQYAKRQLTWFRHQEKAVGWFDITGPASAGSVEKVVKDWYNAANESQSRYLA